ncbi:hypothetical protein OMK73_15430 [Cupriavidus sp. D39]|nr:hypothetical protein [Cupriavidus sp. D39]
MLQIIGTDPFSWVLDPIDGTRAFIAGLLLWGTLTHSTMANARRWESWASPSRDSRTFCANAAPPMRDHFPSAASGATGVGVAVDRRSWGCADFVSRLV